MRKGESKHANGSKILTSGEEPTHAELCASACRPGGRRRRRYVQVHRSSATRFYPRDVERCRTLCNNDVKKRFKRTATSAGAVDANRHRGGGVRIACGLLPTFVAGREGKTEVMQADTSCGRWQLSTDYFGCERRALRCLNFINTPCCVWIVS